MIRADFYRNTLWAYALICTILVLSGFKFAPKLKEKIILHDEQLSIIPKEFYIANVSDERENRAAIAWLLPALGDNNVKAEAYPVDFDGGGFFAVKKFIEFSLPRNTAFRPIVVTLKKFMTAESASPDGRVEGHVVLELSYDLKNAADDPVHLVDYKGNAVYHRTAGSPQEIEPILRQALQSGLVYLNNWMNKQAGSNIKLATGVKIAFTDYSEAKEGDSIYYSVKRPLIWDDFQSKVPGSRYSAEVSPTIGYDEHTSIKNGIVNIDLAIKVCLPKSACWVKDAARNNDALNHEQRHFDVAKIIAERFKQKLRTENLPVNNFDGTVNEDYLDAYREMNSLQKQYDEETRHGSDQYEQQKWDEKIDKELKAFSVR